jgi:hypothetical protein
LIYKEHKTSLTARVFKLLTEGDMHMLDVIYGNIKHFVGYEVVAVRHASVSRRVGKSRQSR